MKKVTAIFDIGKTNKKFFLFDKDFQVVYSKQKQFDEIEDEDGHPCDDLNSIIEWIKFTLNKTLQEEQYKVKAINFSTYGASLVHLDKEGKPLTPLYNYTKPIDQKYTTLLYDKHGGFQNLSRETASPPSGMLNSGVQLFWLKYHRPKVYAKIKYSLHLPQYFSYVFTGIPISDFTSIGCHTMLWDYNKGDYHAWVYSERIDKILPSIASTRMSFNVLWEGNNIKIGAGIHDSSAALLPYLIGDPKPFTLISTGTWSVTLNPFNDGQISNKELVRNSLNYMTIDGKPVRASRLFSGNEYNIQIEELCQQFDKPKEYHKGIKFSKEIYDSLKIQTERLFHFQSFSNSRTQPTKTNYQLFPDFETAYHQLMIELMELQMASTSLALGDTSINKVYIDGGFADNDLFIKLISLQLKDYKIRTAKSSIGSALGAALVMSGDEIGKDFLKKNYKIIKH